MRRIPKMSKKKKTKKKLKKFDANLNMKYSDLMREIDSMQKYLNKIDKKAKKRAKKKAKGDYNLYKSLYKNDISRAKARRKVIEDKTFFDNLETTVKQIEPAAKIISRVIAGLIVTILSINFVQLNISPEQLNALDKLYTISMKV